MKVSDNGSFDGAPTGTHRAICVKVIDIGTQVGEYQGKRNEKHQVIIGWELVDELIEKGEKKGWPFIICKFYTATLGDKSNLRKDLVAWRGREFTQEELDGFELRNILDKPCMISVGLNDNGKSKVQSVMAMPKNSGKMPSRQNELIFFSLDPAEFDQQTFDELSDGFKRMIQASPEYQSLNEQAECKNSSNNWDDFEYDIPF